MEPLTMSILANAGMGLLAGQEKKRQAQAQQIIDQAQAAWGGFTGRTPSGIAAEPNIGLEMLQAGMAGASPENEQTMEKLSQWLKLGKSDVPENPEVSEFQTPEVKGLPSQKLTFAMPTLGQSVYKKL